LIASFSSNIHILLQRCFNEPNYYYLFRFFYLTISKPPLTNSVLLVFKICKWFRARIGYRHKWIWSALQKWLNFWFIFFHFAGNFTV